MSEFTTIYMDIAKAFTLSGAAAKRARHVGTKDLSPITDAVLVERDGKLLWLGTRATFNAAQFPDARVISLGGRTVLPGFVECHTHSVFAGSRAQEFEWRVQGQSYQEIARKGGGILSTVRATRAADERTLGALAQTRALRFAEQGVTTLEIKSGYGLDLETELRCLRVARAVQGPRVVTTYLGAHARAPEYNTLAEYIDFVNSEVLPRVARDRLADRVDIYIEDGFFDLALAERYLRQARELGFALTAHAEQLSRIGGTDLSLNFAPQSVDHVVYLSEEDIDRLARTETTAVLLPTSDLYLKMRYPPARALIERGARIALSTDFNPGTAPSQNLSLVGVLSRLYMGLTQAEVLVGMTLGAAFALGLEATIGSLEVGKSCDLAICDGNLEDLFYSVGHHPVRATISRGQLIAGGL